MSEAMLKAADRMYRTLKVWPCACIRDWDKGVMVLKKECLRCRSIRQWDEAQ